MHRLVLALPAAIVAAAPSFADDFALTAPIRAVTVYNSDGALVTREGTLTLPAGQHRIIVGGLTGDIDEDYQIRVSTDTPGLAVLNVASALRHSANAEIETRKALEARVKALKQNQAAEQNRIRSLDMRLGFLSAMGKGSAESVQPGQAFNTKDWQTAIAFIGTTADDLLMSKAKALEAAEALGRQIIALEKERDSLGGSDEDYYQSVINVVNSKAQDVTISLSYLVEDAEWSIGADATLSSERNMANVKLTATVEQSTGEDWSDVRLSLSTARPSYEIAAEDVEPVFLTLEDPDEWKAEPMPMTMARAPRMAADSDDSLEEVVVVTAARKTTAFDTEFTAPGLSTVHAGDEPQTFTLVAEDMAAKLVVRANPRVDGKNAFVYADVTPTELPRLGNIEASLIRDGHFVGRGDWPELVPGTPVRLPFGLDTALKIEMIPEPGQDGDKGLFGKKTVQEERNIIRVTNNHDRAVSVEITDRVPVSAHKDVDVAIIKGSTPATETDMGGKAGLMLWRKDLAPGEVWNIRHAYRITYPSNQQLEEDFQ